MTLRTSNPKRRAPLPGPLGALAARVYSASISRINRRFDAGRGVVRLDRPVISVGNLSTGGTGKTPVVAWVVRALREAGHDPCVAMRGYGSADGAMSDEAQLHAAAFADLAIVAQPDRTEGLIDLFATQRGERVDCVVLDDGFQHRRLARDLDIVLIDATSSPFEDRLLPAGHLREPVASLKRAGVVIISHAESAHADDVATLRVKVHEVCSGARVVVARHVWRELIGEDGRAVSVESIRGRRIGVACAIGNPDAFLAMARESTGVEFSCAVVLRDHDPYSPDTIRNLLETMAKARPDLLLVTEKDWSKLRRVRPEAWPCPVLRPRLGIEFDSGEAELRSAVLSAVRRPAPVEPKGPET